MHRFLTALALYLSHLNLIACIPCIQIGRGTYHEGGEKKKQLDPFKPGQGFDIIEPMNCYHRFQNPDYHLRGNDIELGKLGKAIIASRVTAAEWSTTQGEYEDACKGYGTVGAGKPQLWLVSSHGAYQYAGLLLRGEVDNEQPGLSDPETVVTFLLPSGVAKVSTVTSPNYPPCKPLVDAGGVGLVGKVDPKQDYAYAPVFRVALALAHRFPDPRDTATKLFESDDPESPFPIFDGAFVTAEKADGECVVIDYRNMPSYMINKGNQPMAQVVHCS